MLSSFNFYECKDCFSSMCHLDKPLTGLKLLSVGKLSKNKDELKNAVEELGGKITGSANKAALCLSSKSE